MILDLRTPAERETVTVSEWRYGGNGHRYGGPFRAELARQRMATAHRIIRERGQLDSG